MCIPDPDLQINDRQEEIDELTTKFEVTGDFKG